MAAADDWPVRRAEVRALLAHGQAIDAMKALMQEMRSFSTRFNIASLPVDTTGFYREPANFGLSLKALGNQDVAVGRFAGILAERGSVFLALGQPARALPDLQAAFEMHDGHDEVARAAHESARSQVAALQDEERRREDRLKVPVTVLTGYLGSGKTTLLNYILRAHHGKRYAVIENEVGSIGIDNQLLATEGSATSTQETLTLLQNGCICCTVRSDLITAIIQILDRAEAIAANQLAASGDVGGVPTGPPLDAILIETTGLADPGPVCKTFYAEEQMRRRARMDGVLTVVDAAHFLTQLRRHRSDGSVNESAQQVAFADRLLLNKVDVVPPALLSQVESEIRRMNESCPIYRCSLSQRPDELPLDDLLGAGSFCLDRIIDDLGRPEVEAVEERLAKRSRTLLGDSFRPASRHDTGIGTCAYTWAGTPLVLDRFVQVMNSIRSERSNDLYRYKAALCVREPSGTLKRAVLQGIHDMCEFEPRGLWPSDQEPKSQMVIIGRNLDREFWGRLFAKTQFGVLDG